MSGFERTSDYTPGVFGCASWTPDQEEADNWVPGRSAATWIPDMAEEPATAAEAWAALNREGHAADAVRSYLAPGPQPRYDTAEARAEAQADREAGE